MSNLRVEVWSSPDLCLRFATCSHVGRRDNNEDASLCAPSLGLLAVADGMGAHRAGELASLTAVVALREALMAHLMGRAPDAVECLDALHSAATAANTRVWVAGRRPEYKDMGTTLSALLFAWPMVAWAHCGDTRIYRMPQGAALEQLTTDHSHPPPKSNVLTRAIGGSATTAIDTGEEIVHSEDRYLICSDGLTKAVPDQDIAAALSTWSPPEAARWLVLHALDLGARDNVTVALVHVGQGWGVGWADG
jgi:serine/threonine protein phosphatase PrpC